MEPETIIALAVARDVGSNQHIGGRILLDPMLEIGQIIDREGAVTMAAPASDTTLPDREVVRCITKAYESMSFPKPEGGIVTVVYPVVFTSTSP